MLAITVKVKILKEEVVSAIVFGEKLVKSLDELKPDSDYRKEIGIFAVRFPEWKILRDEQRDCLNLIRKICTGETSISEARASLQKGVEELRAIDAWLGIPKK